MTAIQTSDVRAFPLDQLVISPENVRQVSPEKKADRELFASLKSVGLLQNLVVDLTDKGMGEVVAGGRRLAALQHLAGVGDIPADFPVTCLVRKAGQDITELSTAENTHREAMHPADEYVAYAKLREKGFMPEEIAEKFGKTKKGVEQRLALGGVAPKLLDAYRKEKLNLQDVMAFTVTNDHDRQLACFKELSRSGRLYAHSIKSWLVGESYSTDRGLGKFVGKAAFEKAGGVASTDLFQETVYLSDPELVVELAVKKLEKEAAKIRSEGWLWVEARPEGAADDDLVRLQPVLVGVPRKMREELETLIAELEEVESQCQEQDWPEELEARYEELSGQIDELEDKRNEKYLKFSKEQMAYSGVIVSVDYHGKLSVNYGLAHKKDVPQPKTENAGDATRTESESQVPSGISQALSDDLRAYRQQIVQASLLSNASLATDVLYYTLACQMLGARFEYSAMISARFDHVASKTSRDDTDQGRAFDELSAAEKVLNTEWLAIEDKGERFKAFQNLSQEDKSAIVTFCVARMVSVDHKGRNTASEALIDQLDIPFAEYWRPTEDNYLKRINISQLQGIYQEVTNNEYSEVHRDKSKQAVVVNVEDALRSYDKGKAWMPEQF